ncbi:MAG: hypothetical protein AB7I35_18800 [Ramlibacter sp.]
MISMTPARSLAAFVALATSILSHAQAPLSAEQQAFVKVAKENLTMDFKDPAGVQYRRTFIARIETGALILCGEVNSKNSYGAYVGFRGFISTTTPGLTIIEESRPEMRAAFQRTSAPLCAVKVIDAE